MRGVACTPEGNLAVLDFAFQGVRFYSARGDHLYDFTPRGEGPGEFLYTAESRLPEWQEVQRWNFTAGCGGFFAVTRNPEMYPVVYRMIESEGCPE